MPTAKQVRMRRGSTLDNDLFMGPEGEVTVDTTVKTLRVHDGSTMGGNPLALADLSNVSESKLKDIIQELLNASGPGGEGEPMAIGDMKMSYAAQDPAEFHKADGTALSTTEYADLYSVIGDRYNLMGVGASPFTYSTVSGTSSTLYDMATDGTNTIALFNGAIIWHTNNAGETSSTVTLTGAAVTIGITQKIFRHAGKFFIFSSGTTYSSTDGLTWTTTANSFPAQIVSNTSSNMNYSNGRFIAWYGTTAPCTGATSTDGINWTPFSTTAIAYASLSYSYFSSRLGLYILFGPTGLVATSSDGTTWTARVTATTTSFAIKNVAENGSMIVANGTLSATVPGVQTSPDGITWTNRTPIASVGTYGLAWSPSVSRFYVGCTGGQTAYSSDGITWTAQTAVVSGLSSAAGGQVNVAADASGTYFVNDYTNNGSSISFAPAGSTTFTAKQSYLIGSGKPSFYKILLDSTNSLVWLYSGVSTSTSIALTADSGSNIFWLHTANPSGATSRKWVASAFMNGISKTVAVVSTATSSFPVYMEGQGRNAKFLATSGIGYVTCAAYGNGLFVLGGNTGLTSTSPDGLSWTTSYGMPSTETVAKIVYNGSYWLAVTTSGSICTSTDASTWEYVTQVLSSQVTVANWNVMWTGNRWLISNGSLSSIVHSTDSVNWTTVSFPALPTGFAEGNGRVVVMTATATYSSDDLLVWTASATPAGTNTNKGIAFGNGQFVIGGGDSTISSTTTYAVINTSPDGITWSQTKLDGRGAIKDIIFADGFFFAYGNYGNGVTTIQSSSTSVYSSQDGFRWTLCGYNLSQDADGISNIPGYGYQVNGAAANFVLLLPEAGYFRLPLKVPASSTDGDYYIKIADPE